MLNPGFSFLWLRPEVAPLCWNWHNCSKSLCAAAACFFFSTHPTSFVLWNLMLHQRTHCCCFCCCIGGVKGPSVVVAVFVVIQEMWKGLCCCGQLDIVQVLCTQAFWYSSDLPVCCADFTKFQEYVVCVVQTLQNFRNMWCVLCKLAEFQECVLCCSTPHLIIKKWELLLFFSGPWNCILDFAKIFWEDWKLGV